MAFRIISENRKRSGVETETGLLQSEAKRAICLLYCKATPFVAAARSRMGCERMMCETELCEAGRNRTMRENGRGDMVKQKDAKAG
jgi:hypothetical protein